MKKIIAILIVIFILLVFTGCSKIEEFLIDGSRTVIITKSDAAETEISGVKLDSGELIVVYRVESNSDRAVGKLMISRSTNGGITWAKADTVVKTSRDVHNPFITKLYDGRLDLVYNEISNDAYLQKNFVYIISSYDYGRIFTVPRKLILPGYSELFVSDAICELNDTTLLLPLQAYDTQGIRVCFVLISYDRGRSWKEIIEITGNHHRGQFGGLVIINAGEAGLICLLDEYGSDNLFRTKSDDVGKTWSAPERINIYGRLPDLFLTKNSTLICCYEDITPDGLSFMKSYDWGKTWEQESDVNNENNTASNPYMFSAGKDVIGVVYSMVADIDDKRPRVVYSLIREEKADMPKAVAVSSSKEGVKIRWNRVKSASYYIVYRSTSQDFKPVPENIVSKNSSNYFTDINVENGKSYYYSISAVKGFGKLIKGTGNESLPSNPLMIEVPE